MKKQLLTLLTLALSAFLLSFTVIQYTHTNAACTGAKNCRACNNYSPAIASFKIVYDLSLATRS
jgi:hypothetical protein